MFCSDSVIHQNEGMWFCFGGNTFYALEEDTFLNINKALTNSSTKTFWQRSSTDVCHNFLREASL